MVPVATEPRTRSEIPRCARNDEGTGAALAAVRRMNPAYKRTPTKSAPEIEGAWSYGQKERVEALFWHGQAILLEGQDVAFDGLTHVGDGGLSCFTLAHAARETRAFSDPESILIAIDDHLSHAARISNPRRNSKELNRAVSVRANPSRPERARRDLWQILPRGGKVAP